MDAMQWDLGLQGLGVLLLMSLGFGIVAHLIAGKLAPRLLWLMATVGYFVGGLLVSEVWFGWATEEELQPNIDGLSFDEVLLFGFVGTLIVLLVTWWVRRRRRRLATESRPVLEKTRT
jgi:hypothetical protein